MTEVDTPETLDKELYLELPPDERGHYLREKIQETLELNHRDGVTVSDLADNLPFDRRAIQKHLEVLTHTNVAYLIERGPTKLYFPNERAMHSGFDDEISVNGSDFGVSEIQNKLGHFILVQEKKEGELGGGILVPFDKFNIFLDELGSVWEEIENEG